MRERHWRWAHLAKELAQLDQWYVWMEALGWKTTQWYAYKGNLRIDVRLYRQGRGPRYDGLTNDEVGTIVTDLERRHFMQSQEMLSGSQLGKSCWIGTMDPNSIWDKVKHQKIRGYDALIMPWVKRQYESAKRKNPGWYMDQEYHMKATPAGGLLLPKCILQAHEYQPTRYGIDSNPEEGYYVVGTHKTLDATYVCNAKVFYTLRELGLFVMTQHHPNIEFELEMNGPGGVVANYFEENAIPFVAHTVTEDNKIRRCTELATKPIIVPPELEYVYRNLTKQIWNKDKRIEKFQDAHWFDATWHSADESVVWA